MQLKHRLLVLLTGLVLSLALMGSSCVNDGVLVSVNLNPIVARFKLGTNTVFVAAATINLDSLIPVQYKNRIRQGRLYDFKVRVEGEYAGAIAGTAAIRVASGEAKPILRFPETGTAPWSAFYTPQSLLTGSAYLTPQPEGINEILRALTTSPLPNVTVSTLGHLAPSPVPNNLTVHIELYIQADAELK